MFPLELAPGSKPNEFLDPAGCLKAASRQHVAMFGATCTRFLNVVPERTTCVFRSVFRDVFRDVLRLDENGGIGLAKAKGTGSCARHFPVIPIL